MEKLENTKKKSKIYYLSHIFKTVNMLNFKLQNKKIRLGYLHSADKRLHRETEILEKTVREKELKISIKLLLHLECITACIAHLERLHTDFGRKFEDLLEIDYPLWFLDLENYEPGDKISKMAKTLLHLKNIQGPPVKCRLLYITLI